MEPVTNRPMKQGDALIFDLEEWAGMHPREGRRTFNAAIFHGDNNYA